MEEELAKIRLYFHQLILKLQIKRNIHLSFTVKDTRLLFIMNIQNFEQAKQYALHRLEQELSPTLHYHDITHTRDDVVPAAAMLAAMEGIQGESLYLLLTAAWFHDLGFIEQALHHELISARIAIQVLPGFGYTEEQIEVVRWAILATALPQSSTTLLEEILTDADLDVLGCEDFMPRNNDLRRELAFLGKEYTDIDWYTSQLKFLETHTYFTASAHKARDDQKRVNITQLKLQLENLSK